MKYKKYIIYAAIFVTLYYLMPLIPSKSLMVLSLTLIYPVANFALSLYFAKKYGFNLLFPVIAAVLFVPAVFIYMNESALIYVVIYFVINLIGLATGKVFKNKKSK